MILYKINLINIFNNLTIFILFIQNRLCYFKYLYYAFVCGRNTYKANYLYQKKAENKYQIHPIYHVNN